MDKIFLAELAQIVGHDGIMCDEAELLTYESDALAKLRSKPGVVVLPDTAEAVQRVRPSLPHGRRAVCGTWAWHRALRRCHATR